VLSKKPAVGCIVGERKIESHAKGNSRKKCDLRPSHYANSWGAPDSGLSRGMVNWGHKNQRNVIGGSGGTIRRTLILKKGGGEGKTVKGSERREKRKKGKKKKVRCSRWVSSGEDEKSGVLVEKDWEVPPVFTEVNRGRATPYNQVQRQTAVWKKGGEKASLSTGRRDCIRGRPAGGL